jgi:signal transduction histidine kinase
LLPGRRQSIHPDAVNKKKIVAAYLSGPVAIRNAAQQERRAPRKPILLLPLPDGSAALKGQSPGAGFDAASCKELKTMGDASSILPAATQRRLATSEERARFDHLLLIVAAGWACYGIGYGVVLGYWKNGSVDFIEVAATLLIRRWGLRKADYRRLQLACHYEATIGFCGIMVTSLVLGQNSAVASWFLAPLPLLVAYLAGVQEALIWAAVCVCGSCALLASDYLLQVTPEFTPGPLIVNGSRLVLIVVSTALGIATRHNSDRQLERLRTAMQAAEAASQAKSAFLANMSHELRTPLNAILGFTGTLLMRLPGEINSEQEEQLNIDKRSANHLLLLINDLLDLAKIESGRLELRAEPVACLEVIDEAVATLGPLARTKGLRLSLDAQAETLVVRADRRALTQIVFNLAANAIRYTDTGEVRLSLQTRLHDGVPHAEVAVTDTGIGIHPDDQKLLFKAITQIKDIPDGSGLGLHLSQQFARLIGGWIEFESELGKGSRFALLLPAVQS